jgi:membrane protease YdiL (CAAX protease family)
MAHEVSQAILGIINVLIMTGSFAAIVYCVRQWTQNKPLVPFAERDDDDAGGVFAWIRQAVARRRGETTAARLPQETDDQFWSDVRLGIGAFLVAFLPMILIHVYLQQFIAYEHVAITAIQSDPSPAVFAKWAIATVLVAPFLEEFVFRNLVQGFLEVFERTMVARFGLQQRWIFGVLPIGLSSLAFAGMHWGQGAAAVPLFLFALVLGYLYFQTHRLTPSVVAHMTLNGFTMVQLWFLAT